MSTTPSEPNAGAESAPARAAGAGPAAGAPSPDPATLAAWTTPTGWRCGRAWAIFLAVVVLGLAADIATKYWAFRTLADYPVVFSRADVLATHPISRLIPFHEPTVVVPWLLEFKLVLNPGAVFGIGAGKQWFFTGFALVALVMCVWMFTRGVRRSDHWSQAALGLVIAGALGNLYDRVVYACVRDFIHPLPGVKYPFGIVTPWSGDEVWPWVSNVADKLLLVGVAVLVVRLWTHPLHKASLGDAGSPPPPPPASAPPAR